MDPEREAERDQGAGPRPLSRWSGPESRWFHPGRCAMTIAFSCPSCEHRLKVRDELVGRKVKCPSCGGGVVVPADEEAKQAAAPAAARPGRPARDEPDEEERP